MPTVKGFDRIGSGRRSLWLRRSAEDGDLRFTLRSGREGNDAEYSFLHDENPELADVLTRAWVAAADELGTIYKEDMPHPADMDLARELRERRQASCRCGWLPSSGESHPCHWQNYSCEKPGTERQVSPGYTTWSCDEHWDVWSSRQRAIGCWRAASTRHTGGV